MPCRRSNTRDELILAINLGGAVIPLALSVFLLFKHKIYVEAAIGVVVMAVITYLLARPVPGVGIAIPPLLPPILAAVVALLISRRHAAPLAYIAGSMGCLLGADVFNLYRIRDLVLRLLRSAARGFRTVYSSPASSPSCWPELMTVAVSYLAPSRFADAGVAVAAAPPPVAVGVALVDPHAAARRRSRGRRRDRRRGVTTPS